MQKACVFVDGENFRHTIEELFSNFNKHDYLPKQAEWATFFDDLVNKATGGLASRLRTYWYVLQHVDCFPYSLSKLKRDPPKLQKILSNHPPYKTELDKLSSPDLETRIGQIADELIGKQNTMQNRFSGWTTLQDGIAKAHAAVEFRRAGAIRYSSFDGSLGKEKAVDVKLATDLITLREIYDVAIIVSGDQDYVPAVQVVKDSGKRVVNVAFETRSGQLLPGGARRLSQVTDTSINVSYADFQSFLKL